MDNFKFLIVGAGRGGTSLIAGLLDYHSELVVDLELHSVECLMGKGISYDGPEVFHERVTAFISRCKQTAMSYPNRMWGNKITTEQISGLEDHNAINPHSKIDVLNTLFNDYLKNIKIIFILRDGRTCVNSKVTRRRGKLTMADACKRWQYSVQCYKFLNNYHANNICVRFEDLLLEPEVKLMEICDFLGVSYQKEMLNGVANRKMLPEYQNEKLDVSKANVVELADNYFEQITDDLSYCGYI